MALPSHGEPCGSSGLLSKCPAPIGKAPTPTLPVLVQHHVLGHHWGLQGKVPPQPPLGCSDVPSKGCDCLPCCLYQAASSQCSLMRHRPQQEAMCRLQPTVLLSAHQAVTARRAPSRNCSLPRSSTTLPQLLHASLLSPFFVQLPFRYLCSVTMFPLRHHLSRLYKLNSRSLCPSVILSNPCINLAAVLRMVFSCFVCAVSLPVKATVDIVGTLTTTA